MGFFKTEFSLSQVGSLKLESDLEHAYFIDSESSIAYVTKKKEIKIQKIEFDEN